MKFIGLIVLYLSAAGAAGATEIAGTEDMELQVAVDLWLANDDATSLPKLAGLAAKNNTAARLLLARIERLDRAPSLYLEGLSRVERLQLFRSPKENGRFYPSWVEIEAAAGHPLARALQTSGLPSVDLGAIERLIELGERQATDHLIRVAALYGNKEIHDQLLADSLVMDELKPFVLSQKAPPEKQADGMAALRYIAQSDPAVDLASMDVAEADTLAASLLLSLGIPFGYVDKDNRWRGVIERWLLRAESVRPIADVCRKSCASEVGDCALTILGLTGGYFEAIRLDSPLENVIPQSHFLSSERAQRMALRRAALMRAENAEELVSMDSVARRSRCLADMIKIERDHSHY